MPRRGWTGPPWWLLAVTVVGFVAATVIGAAPGQASISDPWTALVSAELGDGGRAAADRDEAGGEPSGPAARPTRPTGQPAAVPRQVIGVATFNAYRNLTADQTTADATALATNPSIDVIGWQEAYKAGAISSAMAEQGWRTKTFTGPAAELAVSWRTDEFEYVSSFQKLMAPGVDDVQGNYPVGNRYAVRVTLRDRTTGELFSLVDTHLPQAIEDLYRPGHWRPTYNAARARRQLQGIAPMWQDAPGRWTLGTGDFNFDAVTEGEVRPIGGPTRRFAGKAVSSYQQLGTDLDDTHPVTGRQIDYVLGASDDVRNGRIRFLRQWVVPGLNSDHRALLVRLALS